MLKDSQKAIMAWLQQDEIWYELSQFPNRIQLPRLSTSLQLPENIASYASLSCRLARVEAKVDKLLEICGQTRRADSIVEAVNFIVKK